ncbi:MAG TPA: SpoIID/LytB domain-containing protein [Bacteroidota bacterium]|nr:SpoIID/LytB domain-containing protein [Bacteroidota bacterium]
MISEEPVINVGIQDNCREVCGEFNGSFVLDGGVNGEGEFRAAVEAGSLVLRSGTVKHLSQGKKLTLRGQGGATFTLKGVDIGKQFHWSRKEDQTFAGWLDIVQRDDGTIAAVNMIGLEEYLASVVSSEMNGDAPMEFLKAHAIVSRSWLGAMIENARGYKERSAPRRMTGPDEILRWYDHEDHDLYNVCADDHCQRYQGIAKQGRGRAAEAVRATRGRFITYEGEICDARFSKACGGRTEPFENVWEDRRIPYLSSVSDSEAELPGIVRESEAEDWILSNPKAYCNTSDEELIRRVLPAFDLETTGFYRWGVEYERQQLESILREKSGIDFGTLMNLIPVERGPSGRIARLRVEGTRRTVVVGKELEIRRWLSETHLRSSAFVVMTEREADGTPKRFLLYGAGWGHGVGMCQIGAAVMAERGSTAEEIVRHYYRGTSLSVLY